MCDEWDDMTADEVAYKRYLDGEYTYREYVEVCEEEETEPMPMQLSRRNGR